MSEQKSAGILIVCLMNLDTEMVDHSQPTETEQEKGLEDSLALAQKLE